MKHVAGARKKIAKKTIFNLIGPLSSPAQVRKQVVGVFDEKWMMPFAEALRENEVDNAMIVHSEDGFDEISPFAKTKIIELNNGKIKNFIIDPNELNIINNNKENLRGKNAKYNAQKIIDIYKGVENEFSDAVSLNVAAGLVIATKEKNFKDSYNLAKQHLKSGKVFNHLQKIKAI
jgi:anthranilate phosphoribosyltransferase